MKYRIEDRWSLNAITGAPELNFMVQSKRHFFAKWKDVQQFTTRYEAHMFILEKERG